MISVVVIDDDFRVAKIHSSFVSRVDGYEVAGVAHSGADALRLVKDVEPDLMLLDLYLPDIFGLDLLNQMRVEGLLCDVIVISAGNESKTVQQAVQLGVTNYLLKPFTFADLRQRLDDYRLTSGFDSSVPTGRPIGDRPTLRKTGHRPAGAATEGHESGNGHTGPDPGCEQRRGCIRVGMCRISRHIPGQRSPLPRALRGQRADERHLALWQRWTS